MKKKFTNAAEWCRANLITVYLLLMFGIYPLYLRNQLFDTTEAKYLFFTNVTVLTGVIALILNMDNGKKRIRQNWKKWDLLYVGFLLSGAVSVIASSHPREAFSGEAGRHLGLFLYLVYGIAIVLIVTAEHISRVIFVGYGASTVCVGVLAMLNHYGIDPLGVYTEMREEQKVAFLSTIGHMDFFSNYMAVAFVFFAVLFIMEKDRKRAVWTAVPMAAAGISIACSPADTGFLAVMLFFGLGWAFLRHPMELVRFLLVFAVLFSGYFCMGEIERMFLPGKELDGLGGYLLHTPVTGIAACLAAVVAGGIAYWYRKRVARCLDEEFVRYEKIGSNFKKAAMCLLGVLAVTVVFLFLCANSGKLDLTGHPFLSYLHFSDEWGSLRGYLWRKTVEYWRASSIGQKLIGVGPDTAVYVYDEILQTAGSPVLGRTYDNAHNLILQLLLTHGLIGMLSYLGWWIASVVSAFRTGLSVSERNPLHLAVGFTMLGYFVMMLTSVNIELVTTIPFLLLCLGKRKEL